MKAHSDFTVRGTKMSQAENEIVILVCARMFNCKYVTQAHVKNARKFGVSDDKIDAICAGNNPAFAEKRNQAIYETAAEMAKQQLGSKDVFDRCIKAVGISTVCEIATLFGFYATCCVSLNFCGVIPDNS